MEHAKNYVSLAMKVTGACPPTLFMQGIEGKAAYSPSKFTDERAKDQFAETARLMCLAQGAKATVFVSEAWLRMATEDEMLDLSRPPSQYPDRQEVMIMMGESRNGNMHKILPIIRSDNGQFLGFVDKPAIATDEVQGRFANFLSAELPDERTREQAKILLEAKGFSQEHGHGYGRARF